MTRRNILIGCAAIVALGVLLVVVLLVGVVIGSGGNKQGSGEPGSTSVESAENAKNTGDESINYNINDFKVQDSNGVQSNHDSRAESDLPYRISYGGLAPDGELLGNIVFQVPQGDSGLKLIYDVSTVRGKRSITVTL